MQPRFTLVFRCRQCLNLSLTKHLLSRLSGAVVSQASAVVRCRKRKSLGLVEHGFYRVGPRLQFGGSRGKLVNMMMARSTEGRPRVADRACEFLIFHIQRKAHKLSAQSGVHQSRHSFLPEFFQGKLKSL